ncbi:MAG: TIGR03617 family F420-dependent LLM class oxidoreductase [Proteobacteria bacterium]|nr:TIGR03617 family F420-dependent LLM class oxidoreductase [Pseudomonadota bacterium]HQR04409.1 TIGR03617 family F420-dependent LLM class oxidoreductase [Rhodocyclaceae bacterium]
MAKLKVWASIDIHTPLAQVGQIARRAEAMGVDCITVADMSHDGLLAAGFALQATERVPVATSALVCFPRSPMTVAVAAWDLQAYSGGRFRLGLGPLVPPNIIQKYSTPWFPAAPRMREYLASLRAIFACWQDGVPLNYKGRYYQFTRQQDFAKPAPITHPHIPVHFAAVGPYMTRLAGEAADALFAHPTNTSPRFIREVMRPNITLGAARSGRSPDDVMIIASPLFATGANTEEVARQREAHRTLLATIFSTPNYWPSLELYGWRDRGELLKRMVREGNWSGMSAILTDEMLDTFVPAADFSGIADLLLEQYDGLAQAITVHMPADDRHDAEWSRVIAGLQGRA